MGSEHKVESTVLTGNNKNPDPVTAWIQQIPQATRTRRLMEKDISKLAHCLGLNWRLVLIEMGLSQAEIEHCVMEHQHSPAMQIYSALNLWRVRQIDNATLESFVRLCSECQSINIDWSSMESIAFTL